MKNRSSDPGMVALTESVRRHAAANFGAPVVHLMLRLYDEGRLTALQFVEGQRAMLAEHARGQLDTMGRCIGGRRKAAA